MVVQPTSLSSQLLYATARITARLADGAEAVGTAFYFWFNHGADRHVPVLVTNKHVIEGATTVEFFVHQAEKGPDGQMQASASSFAVVIEDPLQFWVGHPGDVDLCAMPFEPLRRHAASQGKEVFYRHFGEELIPDDGALTNLNALEDIVMVGYPIGLWDRVGNFPILRRGITASHPATDFCGRPEGVIDVACFPGSSGSPVVIFNEGAYSTPDGIVVGTPRVLLLGALYAGPQVLPDGTVEIVDIPTGQVPVARVPLTIHLGYYVKARELLTLKQHLFATLKIKS